MVTFSCRFLPGPFSPINHTVYYCSGNVACRALLLDECVEISASRLTANWTNFHARCLAHFRVKTMISRMLSFSFKTVCYVKSNVHCYLTTGLYISHVLVCHKTTLKPPRSPLLQNNVISHTNQNLEQTTSSENSIIVVSQVHIFVRKFLNPGVLFFIVE